MVATRRRLAASSSSQLLAAVVADDLEAVRRQLEAPAAAEWSSEAGVTALHLAAGFAGPAVLAALLAALPDADGKQAVDAALEIDFTSPEVPHPFLDSGASYETRLAFMGGATPLQIAVYFGDFDAVQQLLAAGASPNVPNHAGFTAMHVCTGFHVSGARGGGLSAPRNRSQRSTPHDSIPAALLAAGGDIFAATEDSAGHYRPPPLLPDYGSIWDMHKSAAVAFLEHAVEAHEQGRWAAPSWHLRPLVSLALRWRCRSFFHRFWERGHYHSDQYKLEVCVSMGHLQALRQLMPSLRQLLAQQQGASLLAKAVESRELDVVRLLLENGAIVTMHAVKQALSGVPQPAALRALLEAGPPPEVQEMEMAAVGYFGSPWTCPLLHLLYESSQRLYAAGAAADAEYRRAAADCMVLLAEAGYKPHTYKSLRFNWAPPLADCNPLEAAPHLFRIHSANSWLWAAYERPAWAPDTHSRFPAAFRSAVRALLLAAHRSAGQAGGHSGGATLGQLPPDLLLQIAGAAASPYSAWM